MLLFKDETESTARKSQLKRSKDVLPQILPNEGYGLELFAAPGEKALGSVSSPQYSLSPSQEEFAIGYFMSSYIISSPFDYLPLIYNTVLSSSSSTPTSTPVPFVETPSGYYFDDKPPSTFTPTPLRWSLTQRTASKSSKTLSEYCLEERKLSETSTGWSFVETKAGEGKEKLRPITHKQRIGVSNAEDAVSSAILAASYASLSVRVGSQKLMNTARKYYMEALGRTNTALTSSDTATLDNCLIAVLLLGLYEAIAFPGGRSLASWTAHTKGAVALIRLRGTKQFTTDLGTRLFVQTCNSFRSSCIQRGIAVSEEFRQIFNDAKQFLDANPFLEANMPNVRAGPLMDKVSSLNARVRRFCPVEELPGLMNDALQLEKEVCALMEMLPESWQYQVISSNIAPACSYQGFAHSYPAYRTVRHWNMLRIMRLFLKEVVWRVSSGISRAKEQGMLENLQLYKDFDAEAFQAVAMKDSTQLITDILASVTHFIDKTGTTFSLASRFLIWPLTIVSQLELTPESARKFAIKSLYDIATQARIPQAFEAARAIELGYPTDW